MAKPIEEFLSPYDPDLIAAIRTARAELYEAQAARRRVMLGINRWVPPKERDVSDVKRARQDLDAARALAAQVAAPKE
jgi:hypothetical protein